MYALARSLLFSLPPEDAHRLAMAALLTLERVPALRNLAARRLVRSGRAPHTPLGLDFPSPVGLAGGFDKDARVPRALAALGFGFLEPRHRDGTGAGSEPAAEPVPAARRPRPREPPRVPERRRAGGRAEVRP